MKFHNQYPERLACIPKPDIDAANGNIVVYGTEIMGGITAHAIEQKNLTFLSFVDSDKRKHGQIYCGHSIISPQELADRYPGAIVLIASSAYRQIVSKLLDLGFAAERIYPCPHVVEGIELSECTLPFSEEFLARSIRRYNSGCFLHFNHLGQKIIQELDIFPTTKCSLKCKECSMHIPYWTTHKDYDKHQIVSTVKKLIDLGYKIDNMLIIGGEPLLYRDLPDLVNTLCGFESIDNVTIVTNGTILFPEQLMATLINNKDKIIIRISNYNEISRKAEEIESLLDKNNISFEDTKSGKWFKNPRPKDLNLPDAEVREKYRECCCNARDTGKLWVLDDKYYPCCWSIIAENIGFNLPQTDFVCLDDPSFADKIEKLFNRDDFFEACRCCLKGSVDMRISVPVAEQLP